MKKEALSGKQAEAGKPVTDRVLLQIKTSRTGEETPEAMVQFLASLTNLKRLILPFWGLGVPISLEIAVIDQGVQFFISVPVKYQSFIESQLVAVYPKAIIAKSKDYLDSIFENRPTLSVGQMKLRADIKNCTP